MKIYIKKGLFNTKALSALPLLALYRLLALSIAIIQINLSNPIKPVTATNPATIIILASIYTLAIILLTIKPLRQGQSSAIKYIFIDVLACVSLVLLTGGISSPFILYTLSPILTAALFFKGSIALLTAITSVIYVIVSHLTSPFFSAELTLAEISYFTIYIIAATLTAVLPYMINVNLRQRIYSESTINERQRISRELHDGIAQTLTMLRWRVQIFQRRLVSYPAELQEVKQLEKLVEKAQYDAREALEIMHYPPYGNRFLRSLREHLESLRQESQINVRINSEFRDISLSSKAEIELLRICQEALTNIRKHSNAKNVDINISARNGHFLLNITDDGSGFHSAIDSRNRLDSKKFGLIVMQERAGLIGGKLNVESKPGQGTMVQVEIPRKSNGIKCYGRENKGVGC